MDYENAYDDGSKRRTTIIVIVAVVVLLLVAGVVVALVLRNRSTGGANVTVNVNGGAEPVVESPPATFQYEQVPDPEKVVGGKAEPAANPPAKEDAPQPGVDRMLTDEEKKNYGYPVEWTVRLRTVKGNLGLQTEITVVDKGNWKLPSTPGDTKKRESAAPASATPPATP